MKMHRSIYPCDFLHAIKFFSDFTKVLARPKNSTGTGEWSARITNHKSAVPFTLLQLKDKSWIITYGYLPWHFVGLKPAAWWNLVMYGLIFLSLLGSGPTLILSSRQNTIGVITNKCKLEKTNNILPNCMV